MNIAVGDGCGDPGHPKNGRRVLRNFAAGSRAYFVPRDGFEAGGQPTVLFCQDNGNWSATTPKFSASSECKGTNQNAWVLYSFTGLGRDLGKL